MGFLDRLFGGDDQRRDDRRYDDGRATATAQRGGRPDGGVSDEQRALDRYRYLLRTAPPERIEEAHAEAFSHLTSDQRRRVFVGLSSHLPAGERPASADPDELARAATRAELREPGTVERLLTESERSADSGFRPEYGSSFANRTQGGPGFGSMFASSLLGSVAGYVIGSAIVSAFLPDPGWGGEGDAAADGGTDASADASGADAGASESSGAESAGWDGGAGDTGGWDGGFGDFGGGGDFGGFDI